jgi:PAS domain S-box-containing protein
LTAISGDLRYKLKTRSPLVRYAIGLLALGLAIAGTYIILHTLGRTTPVGFLYLLAIAAAAWWGGFGPGILVCLTSFLAVPFLFNPRFSLARVDPYRLAITFLVSLLISWMAFSRRQRESEVETAKEELERRVAERTQTLAHEVQERQRVVKELQDREERYRVVTETATDGIVSIDGSSTILFANNGAARLFGYTREELIGHDLTMLMPEYLRAVHKASMQRYVETGARHIAWTAVALPGLHKNGSELSLELSFGEYRQNGRPIFTGIIRDVSERKRAEAQLQHTQKLESLGVLAGGVAHDFNNLLTGILGSASLAFDATVTESPLRPMLRNIIDASERAAHLTRQLLAYTGKGRFILEPINLSTLVREISTLIQTSIPKNVHLRLDLKDSVPLIHGDIGQMQQVVMNLVINGAEAITGGSAGTVVVTTGVQDVDELYIQTTLSPGELRPGRYVSLEVHDTGAGMDEQTISRIFDPFFTTKFTGRGLGLSAVMGIVRSHGGALKVYSTPGQGSTFKVLLPATADAEPGSKAEHAPAATVAQPGAGLVLVVDDEEIVRRTANATLERAGYTVVLAETGEGALDIFSQRAGEIVLVLLDLTMPGIGGEETFRRLKTIRPDAKVILSSGYNEVEAVQRFIGKGLAGFIQKPYTAARLVETVNVTLRTLR